MLGKVFKTGNITVISIPSEMLESLGLGDGSDVSLELDAALQRIIIRPAERRVPGVDEAFARQVTKFIEENRPALEALAHE